MPLLTDTHYRNGLSELVSLSVPHSLIVGTVTKPTHRKEIVNPIDCSQPHRTHSGPLATYCFSIWVASPPQALFLNKCNTPFTLGNQNSPEQYTFMFVLKQWEAQKVHLSLPDSCMFPSFDCSTYRHQECLSPGAQGLMKAKDPSDVMHCNQCWADGAPQ